MNRKKYAIYASVMILLSIVLIIAGKKFNTPDYTNEPVSKTAFYLDTFVKVSVYDSKENYSENVTNIEELTKLVENAVNLCGKYELFFSKTNVNSELYKLNNSKKNNIRISKELYEVISKSIYYSEISSGKFDITISKLADVWDFKNAKVPNDLMISQKVKSVNYENIVLCEINDNYYITINGSSDIDLGGIAKGYIADKIKFYLTKHGVKSGIINLGGNMIVLGDKPDGSDYNVGIQKPFSGDGQSICTLDIADKSIVTSGVYERMFVKKDKIYHHIIDPDTGYPADTGVLSATIISDESIDADALSTTCILLGKDAALTLINSLDNIECILITDDYQIITSDGLKNVYDNEISLKD